MKRIGTAFVLGILWLVFQGTIAGQETRKAQTTDADNRYGEGGTLTTYSDERYRVYREVWKDKNGQVREEHLNDFPRRGHQTWRFSKDDKPVAVFALMGPDDKGKWYLMRGNLTHSAYLPKEEVLKLVEKIQKQFAADGKIPTEVFKTADKNEQFPLAPNEVFSCRRVDVATAKDNINKKIAHIEERRKLMSDTFYYENAVQTLQAAFTAKGVISSMSSADAWGKNGVGSVWTESADDFYKNYIEALNQLLGVVNKRGYSTENEMARLEQAVTRWDHADGNMKYEFDALVDGYTTEAKAYDAQSDYMAKYFQQLTQLQTQNPLPSDAINTLNGKMYSNQKSFDDRIKKMDDVDQQAIRDKIKTLASQQIFKALTEISDCPPETKERKK